MYYPKSKILPNQYTYGNEFVTKSTNQSYVGYYFALSNNTFYTEKEPKEELIKISKSLVEELPKPFYPILSLEDKKRGFMTRHFMKRRNQNYTTIIEISSTDYNNFVIKSDPNTSLYAVTKLNWKIKGNNIEDTNRRLVQLKEGVFPGFSLYFMNYQQFSEETWPN